MRFIILRPQRNIYIYIYIYIYIKNFWPLGTTRNGDWDGWFGPSGREGSYDYKKLRNCPTASALEKIGMPLVDDIKIKVLQTQAKINCAYTENGNSTGKPCEIKNAVCVFNIKKDPCEVNMFIFISLIWYNI